MSDRPDPLAFLQHLEVELRVVDELRRLIDERADQELSCVLEELLRRNQLNDEQLAYVLEISIETLDAWRARFPRIRAVLDNRDNLFGAALVRGEMQ